MDQYLQGAYLCPVNDKIKRHAESIAGPAEDDQEAAQALFRWVRDRYAWDMIKVVDARTLLEQCPDRAMSFSKSSLLISLARSIDIPSRYNLLQCKMKNEYRHTIEDSIHAPAELHIDGEWVTADPTYGPATDTYKSPSELGEKTWEDVKSSEKKASLSRPFIWSYNYLLRFVHPDIRRIRKDLRESCLND